MVHILSADGRDSNANQQFQKYYAYLESVRDRFPRSAFDIANSRWYFDPNDRRCPHDAWLDLFEFREPYSGERRQFRSLSLTLRLFGAYHDGHIELHYPVVYAYRLDSEAVGRGHGDWCYDELRLSERDHLLHEIEWWGSERRSIWLIEASDLILTWRPTSKTG